MKRIKIFLIGTLSIMVITPIVWYSLQFFFQYKTKRLYEEAQSNFSKMYTYITLRGALDQSMYAKTRREGNKLAIYYRQVSNYYEKVNSGEIKQIKTYFSITGDSVYSESIFIPISIRNIGVEEPIYVEEINEGDSVVKAYVFNTSCWGYFVAYLAKSTVHDELPSDSLLNEFNEFVDNLPSSEGTTFGQPSPYGFYCN